MYTQVLTVQKKDKQVVIGLGLQKKIPEYIYRSYCIVKKKKKVCVYLVPILYIR